MSYCRNRFYKVKKIVIALCLQDVKVRSLESCQYPLFNCSIRNLQVEQPLKNGALAFYLFSCSNTLFFFGFTSYFIIDIADALLRSSVLFKLV